MIIIEKNAKNINEAINMIIDEVLGFNSEFARSIREFIINRTPYSYDSITCSDNASYSTGTIGTAGGINTTSCTIGGDTINLTKEQIGADTCSSICDATKLENLKIGSTYKMESYEDFVDYALFMLINNIPTPLRMRGNPYNLTIGNDFTSIRFPNNISVSIKIFTNKDTIKYSINITFHSTPVCDPYIRESVEYKSAIKNGWKVKEDYHKPIKKNI